VPSVATIPLLPALAISYDGEAEIEIPDGTTEFCAHGEELPLHCWPVDASTRTLSVEAAPVAKVLGVVHDPHDEEVEVGCGNGVIDTTVNGRFLVYCPPGRQSLIVHQGGTTHILPVELGDGENCLTVDL
jgi:hypothetical protein